MAPCSNQLRSQTNIERDQTNKFSYLPFGAAPAAKQLIEPMVLASPLPAVCGLAKFEFIFASVLVRTARQLTSYQKDFGISLDAYAVLSAVLSPFAPPCSAMSSDAAVAKAILDE
jgi:hypothetical protein